MILLWVFAQHIHTIFSTNSNRNWINRFNFLFKWFSFNIFKNNKTFAKIWVKETVFSNFID